MFERLRELRKEKGLTCEDMAKLLGLGTKAAYSKKELGRTKFSLEDARKISCILGKDIDDIFLAQCKTLWDFGFRTYDARLKSMIFRNRYSSSAIP